MTSEQLKAWRLRRGLTQAEAAEILHVPTRTYEGWEGRFRPHHALDALTLYVDTYGPIQPKAVQEHIADLTAAINLPKPPKATVPNKWETIQEFLRNHPNGLSIDTLITKVAEAVVARAWTTAKPSTLRRSIKAAITTRCQKGQLVRNDDGFIALPRS